MIEIREFIKEKLKEYDPEFDLREGSVLSDFLINPLSSIFKSFYYDLNKILNKVSITDVSSLSEEDLDSFVMLYGLSRIKGSKSKGEVYFYYSSPASLTIPAGLKLTYKGLNFFVLENFSITYTEMLKNLDVQGFYKVGPVKLIAENYGSEYNIKSNSYLELITYVTNKPVYIISSSDFTEGSHRETNEELFRRLESSLYGKSLSSPISISNLLRSFNKDIQDIEIVGAGHPLMLRDRVYNYVESLNLIKEDFNLVYSGITDPIYDKKHKAYAGCFYDEDPSLEVKFPPINKWTDEFSNDDYKGIYKEDDLNYAETRNKIIISENFNKNLDGWLLNDSYSKNNKLIELDEIRIDNNILILGKSFNSINFDNANVPAAILKEIKDNLTNTTKIVSIIENSLKTVNSYSPIIHKEISYHFDIEIKCIMSTNDNSDTGQLAYITVLRNKDIYLANDGFGIAWRKQPDYLIRMKNNNYGSNTELRRKDIERFEKEHNINGVKLRGEDYLGPAMLEHPEVWYYNVFLVDNDVLQEGIWVGLEKYLDQSGGKNNFIQASKCWIEPNIFYNFLIKIYKGFGVEAWVYPEGATFNSTTHKVINKGTTYPNYTPLSNTSIIEGQNPNINIKRHFGIGVLDTKGSEWKVKNIFIRSFAETFSSHLFKLDVSKFNSNDLINVKYYGLGYDPLLISGNTGVKLGIYNFVSNQWEILGSHTNGLPANDSINLNNFLIKRQLTNLENYKNNNFIYLAAIANNTAPGNTNHYLRTYYISLDNGEISYINKRNCTDIYVKDYNNIITSKIKANVVNNKVTVQVPFLFLVTNVIESYSKLPFNKNSYMVICEDPGLSYSNNSEVSIVFNTNLNGALVEVEYKYWASGSNLFFILNDPNYRYPCSDYLLKIMPPVIIKIERLNYKGNIDVKSLTGHIKEFINNFNSNKFDKSDLINYLYNFNIDFIDLNIDIKIYEYNLDMTYNVVNLANSYTIPNNKLCRFFTDYEYLTGVFKLDV